MATAADQHNNKRTRIDTTLSHGQSASPLAAAKNVVTNYCESLHTSLQDLLTDSAIKNFLLHMEISNRKARAVTKMETEPDYVPRSLKLNCTLHATKLCQQDPEYQDLATALSDSVTAFQNAGKATVIASARLDSKVHKNAATKALCEGIYKISSAFITINGHNVNQVHKFSNTIMERFYEEILPIFELDDFATLDQFQSNYVTFTTATAPLPNPFVAPDNHLPHNAAGNLPATPVAPNPYVNQQNADANTRKNEATISHIWRCIRTCYIDSWHTFIRQQKHNDTALKLKKLSTDFLTTNATEAAQMQVDQEPAVNPQLLQTLIAQGVAQATAPLRATIQSLEAQVKNNPRSPRGASRAQAKSGRGTPRQPRGGRGAAEADNASASDNADNSSNQSNKRSGKRNAGSNRRGNKQNRRSKGGRT